MTRVMSFLLLGFAAFAVGGCGAKLPPLGTVSGVVTQGGKPVEGVSIEFVPDGGGRPSMAVTDAEGKYKTMYLPDAPGALVGKHTIRYEFFGPQPAEPTDPDAMFVPSRKPDALIGGKLEPAMVEVTSGSNQIDFEVVKG